MADEQEATTPKKPAEKKGSGESTTRTRSSSGEGSPATRARSSSTKRTRPTAVKVARAAREQLTELLDRDSEAVVGVQRTEDGWTVDVELVETRRIPDTTDVLAIYRVELDGSATVEGYHRIDRYIRGSAEGGVAGE